MKSGCRLWYNGGVKVLVIKIAAIGDFLMATPALRSLKASSQVSELMVLAGRSIQTVVEASRLADKIYYLDDRVIFRGHRWQKIAAVWRISRRLRRERIDIGFNFHRDWRFSIILRLAGIPRRIGFARGARYRLLTDAVAIDGIKHHIFHYCDLVRVLGVTCLDFRMAFVVPAKVDLHVQRRLLKPAKLADYVAIAPGGASNVKERMEIRRWGADHYAALAGMLVSRGRPVVLVGSDDDAAIAAVITKSHPQVIDWTGKTTLVEAAAILKRSRLVISNDSGLMHLAAAVGARVLAIFGPTHPAEKKPLTPGSRAVWKGEKLACAPCYRDGRFPQGCSRLDCFERVSPQEICRLAEKMWD